MQNDNAQQTESADQFLRRFTRELPVSLNEHENQMYGKMLAEKCKEQELAIEKKKQVTADHNNRIKVITNEIKRLADARAKGEELRPVICGERIKGNVIEIVRIDRGEVVDTRPADLKDLQMQIPGTGMPEIPEGFDEGPRGDGLGTCADQPVPGQGQNPEIVDGEMVTSSTGGEVYVTDPDDARNCDACGEPVNDGDETVVYEGSTIHVNCAPEGFAADGDAPPDNVVHGDFSGVPGQGDGESEDDYVDRKLREREEAELAAARPESSPMSQREKDIAQRQKEIDEAKAAKPTRERSKSKNDAKGGGKGKGKRK